MLTNKASVQILKMLNKMLLRIYSSHQCLCFNVHLSPLSHKEFVPLRCYLPAWLGRKPSAFFLPNGHFLTDTVLIRGLLFAENRNQNCVVVGYIVLHSGHRQLQDITGDA